MNKSRKTKQNITFNDLPYQTSKFDGLPTKVEDYNLEDYLVSEVGTPVIIPTMAMGPVAAFELRKAKDRRIPYHMFGQLSMGNAMQAAHITQISVPLPGLSVQIDPSISRLQMMLCNEFSCVRADSLFIMYLDPPIGSANELKVSAYLLDSQTQPPGVRWRTNRHKCIAVYLPWESDVNMFPRNMTRNGHPGLSVRLTNVEENTTESVVNPVQMTIIQILCNVQALGYRADGELLKAPLKVPIGYGALKWTPYTTKLENKESTEQFIDLSSIQVDPLQRSEWTFRPVEPQSDPNPAIGEIAEENPQATVVETPTTVPVESVAPPVVSSKPGLGNQQADIRNKWVEVGSFTLGSEDLNKAKTINLTLANLAKIKGENIVKPLTKNVYFRGGKGYYGLPVAGKFKLVCGKPIQITGLVQVDMGFVGLPYVFYTIGGAMREQEIALTEFYPRSFSAGATTAVRVWNQDSVKCSRFGGKINVTLINFNRTSDIADVKITALFKPSMTYYIPIKPRPAPKSTNASVFKSQLTVADLFSAVSFQIDNDDQGVCEVQAQSDDYVTPPGACELIRGEINTFSLPDEDQPNEGFLVRLGPFNLKPGAVTVVPLDLPQLKDTLSEQADLNEITEKFERFAHHAPTGAGLLGPVMGSLSIHSDWPTGIRGQLASNVLPADLNDETAKRLFGLGSILGMAGSALSTLGGPLLSGALSAGAGMLNSVVPGLGNIASSAIGSILGQGPTPEQSSPTNSPQHEIPFPRFMEIIRLLLDGTTNEPMMPQLIMQLMSIMTDSGVLRADQTYPVYVHLRLTHHGTERVAYDRAPLVVTPPPPSLLLDNQDIAYILSGVSDDTDEVVRNKLRNLAMAYYTRTSKYVNAFDVLDNIKPITDLDLVMASRVYQMTRTINNS